MKEKGGKITRVLIPRKITALLPYLVQLCSLAGPDSRLADVPPRTPAPVFPGLRNILLLCRPEPALGPPPPRLPPAEQLGRELPESGRESAKGTQSLRAVGGASEERRKKVGSGMSEIPFPPTPFVKLGLLAERRAPALCPVVVRRKEDDLGTLCPAGDPGGRAARGALNVPLMAGPTRDCGERKSRRVEWLVPRQKGARGAELSRGLGAALRGAGDLLALRQYPRSSVPAKEWSLDDSSFLPSFPPSFHSFFPSRYQEQQ